MLQDLALRFILADPEQERIPGDCKTACRKKRHYHAGGTSFYLEANKWELSHGGLSGRTAQQFVDYLLGM